ncbi:MAG: YihY/virulence factor BrkB family protein [Bacilli bacterium]|nr:YihY/virulence factor BrkB family protein [Bacilli bacterium]
MEKARDFIFKIFKLLMRPEMRILPGQLAFFLVMTIIPLVAVIATMAAALSISTETIRVAISSSVPNEIATIINSIISGNGINFNIIIFYFSAFLLASNGTYSMINISNEIYKVKPNTIIKRRIKAIIMTFILVGLFLFLIAVPVFGTNIFDILKQIAGDGKIVIIIQNILHILKYPIILLILFFNIDLMYILSPDEEIPTKTTTKGAIFTSIGWILSTEIFAFYIEKFTQYDLFYGSISNILILLLWVYLLSYIFVLGMVINAGNYKLNKNL